MPTTTQEILDQSKDQALDLISRVYEAGRMAGRAEAEATMRDKLTSVLNLPLPQIADIAPHGPTAEEIKPRNSGWSGPRAPRGSVRPAIVATLKASPTALSPKQILQNLHDAGHTLVKSETIRSTLHKMAEVGAIQQTGDGWILNNTSAGSPGLADDELEDDAWGEPLDKKAPTLSRRSS